MNNTKISALVKTDVTVFLILLAIAVVAPYSRNQFITGTIVNSTLFIAAAILGIRWALLMCIIPSTIALATGLLPAVLAPMIPFVILGNALLVIVFHYLARTNYWLGAVTGAVLKFGLLAGAISIVTNLIVNEHVAVSVANMMSWPQLVTALGGGAVAFGILHLKNKTATK